MSSALSRRPVNSDSTATLVDELDEMIRSQEHHARHTVAGLYWQIGNRLSLATVLQVGRELQSRHGPGFGQRALLQMIRFARAFPDLRIVCALRRQFSWSHFKALSNIPDTAKRDYYTEMCRLEGWSTRLLAARLASRLYERTLLAKMPAHRIRECLLRCREKDEVAPGMVLQNPYLFDFLNLDRPYSEKDLESAIPQQMGRFLRELGGGFAFVERQKRINVDGRDYYIDLLLYHHRMCRYVVIELKIGGFKPAYSAQVELYLQWLDRHLRQRSQKTSLGIILCAGRLHETEEYLNLDARGIHVAEYSTQPLVR